MVSSQSLLCLLYHLTQPFPLRSTCFQRASRTPQSLGFPATILSLLCYFLLFTSISSCWSSPGPVLVLLLHLHTASHPVSEFQTPTFMCKWHPNAYLQLRNPLSQLHTHKRISKCLLALPYARQIDTSSFTHQKQWLIFPHTCFTLILLFFQSREIPSFHCPSEKTWCHPRLFSHTSNQKISIVLLPK